MSPVEIYGPQGEYVVALVRRAHRLTEAEVLELAQAWNATWSDALNGVRDTVWRTIWDGGRYAGWNAARDIMPEAWDGARYFAWDAIRDSVVALFVRDLIHADGFTQGYYDLLTGPWRRIIGPIHPGDDELELNR